jgi:hypothetical protein
VNGLCSSVGGVSMASFVGRPESWCANQEAFQVELESDMLICEVAPEESYG